MSKTENINGTPKDTFMTTSRLSKILNELHLKNLEFGLDICTILTFLTIRGMYDSTKMAEFQKVLLKPYKQIKCLTHHDPVYLENQNTIIIEEIF